MTEELAVADAMMDWLVVPPTPPMLGKQSQTARERKPSDETNGSERNDQKRQKGTAG